jgi:hypothetical protein
LIALSNITQYEAPGKIELAKHAYTHDKHSGRLGVRLRDPEGKKACMTGNGP